MRIRHRAQYAAGSAGEKLPITLPERIAIVLASLLLAFGLIAVLSGFFASRDPAGVATPVAGPGQQFPDLGHAHLRPGQPRPAYNSSPPTSGAHMPEPIAREGTAINDDQLLQALELGDVVIMYGTTAPPPVLKQLARALAPAFSPALGSAGQAVILARRTKTTGLIALAWAHMASVGSARDPLLREFVSFWLGRGAPGR